MNDIERPREWQYYYVSAQKDYETARGGKTVALVGPFGTHAEALARVADGRSAADRLDPNAAWYAYGTILIETKGRPTVGILNPYVGLDMAKTTFEEDTLVEATDAGVTVRKGDKGRVMETGTWEYHRVYWPRYKLVAYHLGSRLRPIQLIHPSSEDE